MLKDNRQRGNWILLMFKIMIFISLTVAIFSLVQHNSFENEYYDENDILFYLDASISLLYLIGYICCAVFFILWFRRAYYNLQAAGIQTVHENIWAGLSWFIPILSWFRPYQIMSEIWEQLQIKVGVAALESKTLINTWWALWIFTNFFDTIISFVPLFSYGSKALMAGVVDELVSVATLLVIIQVIQKIMVWEEKLYNQDFEMSIEDHLI